MIKKPTKRAIAKWGGVFPPEMFGELEAFLADENFVYLGVDPDGRLEWVRQCNTQLGVKATLTIEVTYVANSEVNFTTWLAARSGNVAKKMFEASQSGIDPTRELANVGSEDFIGIASFNLNKYDSEQFGDGFYRQTTYQLGNCKPALAQWMTQYHRTLAPLISTLDDPHRIIALLESSPSLPRYRMGDKSWVSIAPQLYSAFIYFALGQLDEALALTKRRQPELLEHQIKALVVAQHYFEAMKLQT